MRKVVCVVFCVLLASCGNENLLVAGLSPSLHVEDTAKRAEELERYLGLMCMQAGLGGPDATLEKPSCLPQLSQQDWWRVISSALNNITSRCEIYIASLDKAKLDREAYLAQLRKTASTTGLLLKATGVAQGSLAISTVAAAFNFADSSLESYYSRLLLEVKGGVVGILVLKIQTAYRDKLKKIAQQPLDDPGYDVMRPYAFYVITGYIRICLPASIEGAMTAKINEAEFVDIPPPRLMMISSSVGGGPRVEPRLKSLEVLQRKRAEK